MMYPELLLLGTLLVVAPPTHAMGALWTRPAVDEGPPAPGVIVPRRRPTREPSLRRAALENAAKISLYGNPAYKPGAAPRSAAMQKESLLWRKNAVFDKYGTASAPFMGLPMALQGEGTDSGSWGEIPEPRGRAFGLGQRQDAAIPRDRASSPVARDVDMTLPSSEDVFYDAQNQWDEERAAAVMEEALQTKRAQLRRVGSPQRRTQAGMPEYAGGGGVKDMVAFYNRAQMRN